MRARECMREKESESKRKMENMFALFKPICLCGSALISTWASWEAEYAKQLEQRLITLKLLRKNMLHFLEFCCSRTAFVWNRNVGFCYLISLFFKFFIRELMLIIRRIFKPLHG